MLHLVHAGRTSARRGARPADRTCGLSAPARSDAPTLPDARRLSRHRPLHARIDRPADGAARQRWPDQIGRAPVCTPVTNAHIVCRLLLQITKTPTTTVQTHIIHLTHN